MTIDVQHLNKRFGAFAAVDDVSMRVEEGSLTALLGPSGSGKTTVLRMIAGLEVPDSGSISIAGADVTNVPAQKRNVGFVFQQYALFKHMRIRENIAFPLKIRKWKREAIEERVSELLSLLRLVGIDDRYPTQISGGQRQRVALARALASHPSVLLLDEPFSALDARVRDELREWLRGLHQQLHVTSIFVTHDQTEAMELAERIVIMNEGRIAQEGLPDEIMDAPRDAFVMNFLGRVNVLQGQAQDGVAEFRGLRIPYPAAIGSRLAVAAYFRPQSLVLAMQPMSESGSIRARIDRVVPVGGTVKVHLVAEDGGEPLLAEIERVTFDRLGARAGAVVFATPADVRVFDSAQRWSI